MSMKRILGMMLASRMAGRGMRGGMKSGGLGGLASIGLLGGRKASLAALGYMAYRAYQDRQARTGDVQPQSAAGSGRASSGASSGLGSAASGAGLAGMLGGIVKSLSDTLSGAQGAQAGRAPAGAREGTGASSKAAFTPEEERAAETFSEETALLLVRAMVAAANADGAITAEERERIMSQANEAGADAEDRRALEAELANPQPLDELLGQVRDQETAEEFYLASRMAIDGATEANRAYLAGLRERLGLAEQDAADINAMSS
jgi:uncharacterized membrane protein YebE (DUF533 family)